MLTARRPKPVCDFSFAGLVKEMLVGGLTGEVGSATFYGVDKATQAIGSSIRNAWGSKSGSSSRKSINLPSAKKVKIDMEEVLSGHTSSGKRAQQSQIKDLFPDRMDAKDIEKEIREAYGNAKQVGSPQFDGVDTRIKLQGNGRNGVVEMWHNKSLKRLKPHVLYMERRLKLIDEYYYR